MRPISDSVRRATASVSTNMRRKTASIARRAAHIACRYNHCGLVHPWRHRPPPCSMPSWALSRGGAGAPGRRRGSLQPGARFLVAKLGGPAIPTRRQSRISAYAGHAHPGQERRVEALAHRRRSPAGTCGRRALIQQTGSRNVAAPQHGIPSADHRLRQHGRRGGRRSNNGASVRAVSWRLSGLRLDRRCGAGRNRKRRHGSLAALHGRLIARGS